MADNVTVDNGTGTDYTAATDEVTYSGDTASVQLVRLVDVTGAEGSKAVQGMVGVGGGHLTELLDHNGNAQTESVGAGLRSQGDVTHDAPDSGNPIKVGGKANAAAPTNVAENDRANAWFLLNGSQATTVTAAGALIGGDATNGLDVDVTRVGGTVTTGGVAAHASPTSGNPVYVAGRASAVIPTDVGADGDAAGMWTNRNGATVVLQAPHVGLNSDPWNLVHEGAQYTSAQTSTVLVAGGASEKIVVTQVQIQAYATTAGTAILYFGTGAFSRGTNRAVFDGEFAPSATLKPGVTLQGPFIAGTNGDDLMVTTTNALSITFSVWYYVVT